MQRGPLLLCVLVVAFTLSAADNDDGAPIPPPRGDDGGHRLPLGLAYNWYMKAHPNGTTPHPPGQAPSTHRPSATEETTVPPTKEPSGNDIQHFDEESEGDEQTAEAPPPNITDNGERRLPAGMAYEWYMRNNPNATTPHPPAGQPPAVRPIDSNVDQSRTTVLP